MMSPEFLYWLSLAVKLALSAGIVVTASFLAERAGPLIGALVVTLPVTVWPAYLFLSLEHDATFVAATAVGGIAMVAVNGIFMLVYAAMAQRFNLAVSMGVALLTWLLLAVPARSYPWTFGAAVMLNLIAYPISIWLGSGFRGVKMPPVARRWYDLPFRTSLVCALIGTVLLISNMVGPIATGFVAVFPISTTSTVLILHPRVGGRPTAAVAAHGVAGLASNGVGLIAFYLALPWFGTAGALAALLLAAIAWNLGIWVVQTRLKTLLLRKAV